MTSHHECTDAVKPLNPSKPQRPSCNPIRFQLIASSCENARQRAEISLCIGVRLITPKISFRSSFAKKPTVGIGVFGMTNFPRPWSPLPRPVHRIHTDRAGGRLYVPYSSSDRRFPGVPSAPMDSSSTPWGRPFRFSSRTLCDKIAARIPDHRPVFQMNDSGMVFSDLNKTVLLPTRAAVADAGIAPYRCVAYPTIIPTMLPGRTISR